MDSAKKKIIEENLNTLDYLKGTGIISTHKRKLADESEVVLYRLYEGVPAWALD